MNGRYQLHNMIGKGGMGIVHQATDRLTGGIVALKQVHLPTEYREILTQPGSTQEQSLRLSLAQEFQILAGLRHPYIISVLDYGFDAERQPFFTMTYLPDAQTILEAGTTMNAAGKLDFIRQMLQALAYLHRRDVVHRDLKPNNVLVSGQAVRVLDFGLSISKDATHSSAGGSLRYLAPELMRREDASKASDLYAAGVMAYELFAGRHPFDVTSGKFAQQVQNDDPNLSLLDIDETLAEVVGQLLAKRPEERFSSAEACLAAIRVAQGNTAPIESAAIRESFLQAATFVGRKHEMKQLKNALAEANAGSGAAWLIGGESGVGKTRLLEELRIHALVSGWQVLTGQTVAEGGVPYQLWQEIVPHLVLNSELSDLEVGVLRQAVPSIGHLFERFIPKPPELSGQAAQQRLALTLIALLQRQTQPVLLLLEDLQWAHESLVPFKQMLRIIEQLPRVIVLATYRNDERPHLPEELRGVQVLTLDRLNKDNIEELSQAILGEQANTPQIVSLLAQETEGNTFFIVEVMRALAEEAGQLDKIGNMTLPTGVFTAGMQRLLQRRLQKVSATDQGLLHLAAISGRQLDLPVLQRLAPYEDVEDWIQRTAETAVLTVRDNQWRFAHDKLREGVLDTLTEVEAVDLHAQVAQAIEQVYPDDINQAAILVHHWHKAGNQAKERQYAQLAGEHAQQRYANNEAIEYLTRALFLTPLTDTANRCALLLAREQTFHLLGDREAQAEDLVTLAVLAEEGHLDIEQRVMINLQQAAYYEAISDYPAVIIAAEKGIKQAQVINSVELQAIGNRLLGQAYWYLGKPALALAQARRASNLVQGTALHREIVNSLRDIGYYHAFLNQFEESVDYSTRALDLSHEIGDKVAESEVLNNLGIAHSLQGKYSQAAAYYKRCIQVSREINNRRHEAYATGNLGLDLIKQGAYDKSQEYLEATLSITREVNDRSNEGTHLSNLSLLMRCRGQYENAVSIAQEAIELARETGELLTQGTALTNLGNALTLLGNLTEAELAHTHALTLYRKLDTGSVVTEPLAGLGRLALWQGNLDQAKAYVEEILAYVETYDTLGDVDNPFEVYLTCFEVLQESKDERAEQFFLNVYTLLQNQAAEITDLELRQSFLENLSAHREIMSLYENFNKRNLVNDATPKT